MIAITDKVLAEYLRVNKKFKLSEIINLKKYTVSDTPLTYRQTNSLDEGKLLDSDRENKLGWRKFSYKELVYFHIIFALREFGINNEQLKPLWEAFFKEPIKEKKVELTNKSDAEIAIGCVWGGVEMTLIFDGKGNIIFADPFHMALSLNENPQIKITLSEIINKLNSQLGWKPVPIQYTLQSVMFDSLSATTPKESELLRIIREKEYSAIRVKKKNGVIATAYAEKNKDKSELTTKDLVRLIETKEHMNITVVKRDGKIVSYKSEETIKL